MSKKDNEKKHERIMITGLLVVVAMIITFSLSWYYFTDKTIIADFEIMESKPFLTGDNLTLNFKWQTNYDSIKKVNYKYISGCLILISNEKTDFVVKGQTNNDKFIFNIPDNCTGTQRIALNLDTGREIKTPNLLVDLDSDKELNCKNLGYTYLDYNVYEQKEQCCIRQARGYYCEVYN